MKNKELESIKNIMQHPFSYLGFITNLGLITLAYLIYLIFNKLLTLSLLWKINVFAIAWLIFYFILKSDVKRVSKIYEFGFILSGIITAIGLIVIYVKTLF